MATVDVSVSISNKSISPNLLDPISITVTNNSNKSIKAFSFKLIATENNREYSVGPEYSWTATNIVEYITSLGPKILNFNNYRSFQVNNGQSDNIYTYLNANNIRATQVKIKYTAVFADNSKYQSSAINISNIYAINKVIAPKISVLKFVRCDDQGNEDQFGTKLLTTLKTDFSSSNDRASFKLTIVQSYNNAPVQTVIIPANDSRLDDFYNGIFDSNIFLSSFSVETTKKYTMTVTLTDTYESSVLVFIVSSSFVNVHLSSAANGGVAFGKLSSAENNSPKFECVYPATLDSTLTVSGNTTLKHSLVLNGGDIYIRDSNNANQKVTIAYQTGEINTRGSVGIGGNLTITGNISTVNGDFSTTNGRVSAPVCFIDDIATHNISGHNGFSNALNIGDSGSNISITGNNISVNGNLKANNFRNIRSGLSSSQECPANSYIDTTISFNPVFSSTPVVIATPYNIESENFSVISCAIMSVSTSSATIRTYNRSTSASHTISVSWIAHGTLS